MMLKIHKLRFLNAIFFVIFLLLNAGCATYKMQVSPKYNDGYVVTRSNNLIPEYTVDEKNKAPQDKQIAKERLKRRWKRVEYYYRNMGYIQGVLASYGEYVRIFFLSPLLSPFVVPIHIVQQYKYEHNPEYKEMVDKRDEEEELQRRQKVDEFRNGLEEYIRKDMLLEKPEELILKEGNS